MTRIAELPRRRRERTGISWITYGDMLADIIFTEANEIAAHITAWRRVIDHSKADIVVADYAPGAVLAARDFARSVNVGDGYTMPPHEMHQFPRLWPGDAPNKHAEAEVAARISEALSQHGRAAPELS